VGAALRREKTSQERLVLKEFAFLMARTAGILHGIQNNGTTSF